MEAESARELAWIRSRLSEPLAEAPGAAIIATNLEGRVAFWNPQAKQLYGWRPDQAIGRDILDLTPSPSTRGQSEEILAALKPGRTWEGEIGLRHRDGASLRAFVVDVPVGDFESGQGAMIGLSCRADQAREIAASAAACRAIARRFGG